MTDLEPEHAGSGRHTRAGVLRGMGWALVTGMLLAGCGRKGALYLPEEDETAAEPETRELPSDREDNDRIDTEVTR
jgi:predicted small lipoprotein YifL